MKSPATLTRAIPLHDYGPALQSAVSWLGERYLLAEPSRVATMSQAFLQRAT